MKTRLYLVDDHAMFRDALRELLISRGYDVVGVSTDPTEAMADLLRLLPDVLLLDLNLGSRSGFELLADMQRRHLSTRTVVLTMSPHPRHVAEALRYGAAGYLLKASSSEELTQAIDAVQQGERHYQGKVAEMAVAALSAADDASALGTLSAREQQVIALVVKGSTSAEVAELLHLSPKTVDSYRSRLMAKLKVKDVTGLVRFALRAGLISADEL
jgi:two-component system invasion response regulator UvrY